MADVNLSKAVRANLLSLQNTSILMGKTQERLATGNKVNSALDNPTSFFTASALNSRASDMGNLMDSMANGIKTLEAADNGLKAITKTLESMQSTLRQARQDKSFQTGSYTIQDTVQSGDKLSFTGGAVGTTAVDIELGQATSTITGAGFAAIDFSGGTDEISFDISVNGGTAQTITITQAEANAVAIDNTAVTVDELAALINAEFEAAGIGATAGISSGQLTITSDAADESVADVTIANFAQTVTGGTSGLANGSGTDSALTAKSVDELVGEINADAALEGKIRASNDNGKLRIENLSTQVLNVDGVSSTGVVDGASAGAQTILGNQVRADLADQFNELRDQLDKLADDASFNGINLLRGDNLKITFNETGTSEINIQTKDGESVNALNLGVPTTLVAADLDSDTSIDGVLGDIKSALNDVRSQASAFGSNLSVVENRQEFTKSMINTLETGAANLTLADTNEEAANLLALQTRQQLSSQSLALASQADQAVLQLLR